MIFDYKEIKKLAKEMGRKIDEFLALSSGNDPFYSESEGRMKNALWFKEMWDKFGGPGSHLRRLHYQIVSQETPILRPNGEEYLNTQKDWDFLTSSSKAARYVGLVDVYQLEDHYSPPPICFAEMMPSQGPSVSIDRDDSQYRYAVALPQFEGLPSWLPDTPWYGVDDYVAQQAVHIELWIEKSTMNDVLVPIAERYKLNLVTGKGELSITAAVNALKRMLALKNLSRQTFVILYLSDYDPAGTGMPISVSRKLEYYQRTDGQLGLLDIRLCPIVLTAPQVKAFNLPRVPVKETDKRKDNWEILHGEGQVELDALEALYPGKLAEIVEQEILKYYDPSLQSRADKIERQLRADLEEQRKLFLDDEASRAIDDLQDEYKLVKTAYRNLEAEYLFMVSPLERKVERLNQWMADLMARTDQAYDELAERMKRPALDLDDYALPEAKPIPKTNGYLYDSRLEYMAQLDVYHAYRKNKNEHEEALT